MSEYVPADLRRLIRERAGHKCEYCLLHEDDAFLPHEPDHVFAVKHRGETNEGNLALTCFVCNRGKAARYDLISGGETRTMLDIPRYDFNWQLLYRYAEPVLVKAGDTLRFTAWYDNSSGNPANPDPNKEVKWGLQTQDERHLGYVEYIVRGAKPGDPNPLSPRGCVRGAVRNFFGGSGSPEPNVGDALFQQLDADGNGNVSRDEVKAKYSNNPAASTTIFDRLDTDKNGQLNQQELRKLSEIIGR